MPIALLAVTVNVYAVPLVRPVTVMGDAVPATESAPGLEVTVYPVITDPPSASGAVKVTLACPSPAVAIPIAGAGGGVETSGVTLLDGADLALVPNALLAVTVNVYAVPSVRPATVMGDAVPVAVIPPGIEDTV